MVTWQEGVVVTDLGSPGLGLICLLLTRPPGSACWESTFPASTMVLGGYAGFVWILLLSLPSWAAARLYLRMLCSLSF